MDDLHDDLSDLAAHVADELASAEHTKCGILYERSEELGDNGGCEAVAIGQCAVCSTPVCELHGWGATLIATGVREAALLCAVCYGIKGFERAKAPADGGQPAPLSDARLAADILRQWFLSNEPIDADRLREAIVVAINALTERERLLAIVRWVAENYPSTIDSSENGICFICFYCQVDDGDEHDSDCLWMQARAALAAADAE